MVFVVFTSYSSKRNMRSENPTEIHCAIELFISFTLTTTPITMAATVGMISLAPLDKEGDYATENGVANVRNGHLHLRGAEGGGVRCR